jgi:hypothetical protein
MARRSLQDFDLPLIGAVVVVWAILAALYEFVPDLRMPGSTLLWGSGALVFAAIGIAMVLAGRYGSASPTGRNSASTEPESQSVGPTGSAMKGGRS